MHASLNIAWALAVFATHTTAQDFAAPSALVAAASAAHRHEAPGPSPTPFLMNRHGGAVLGDRQLRPSSTAGSGPSTTFTVTAAPDSTCGFLSASAGNAITCENRGVCSWEGDNVSAILCQNGLEVYMKINCIERSIATDEAQCDDTCQSNEFNLLCTESSAPFCRTYVYPGGIRDFRCASTSVTRVQSVDFTYSGQRDRGEFVTTLLGASTDTTSSAARPSTSSSARSTSEETTSTAEPGPTDTPAPVKKSGSSTNIGAIVGGVVGGVALLAAIAFGIYFMRRKSTKSIEQHGGYDQGQGQQPAMAAAPVQYVGYPPSTSPGSPPPQSDAGYGWKSGMGSPVHTSVPPGHMQQQQQQQPYDAVSDVQSTRMSEVYTPMTAVSAGQQPGTIHEVDSTQGHHRGQLHEMQ